MDPRIKQEELPVATENILSSRPKKCSKNEINQVLEKTQNNPLSVTNKDVYVLIIGLNDKKLGKKCYDALLGICYDTPKLFDSGHLDLLVEGLDVKETREYCSGVLSYLAVVRPELFDQKHIDILAAGLQDASTEDNVKQKYLSSLVSIAVRNHEHSKQIIDSLISGLDSEDSFWYGVGLVVLSIIPTSEDRPEFTQEQITKIQAKLSDEHSGFWASFVLLNINPELVKLDNIRTYLTKFIDYVLSPDTSDERKQLSFDVLIEMAKGHADFFDESDINMIAPNILMCGDENDWSELLLILTEKNPKLSKPIISYLVENIEFSECQRLLTKIANQSQENKDFAIDLLMSQNKIALIFPEIICYLIDKLKDKDFYSAELDALQLCAAVNPEVFYPEPINSLIQGLDDGNIFFKASCLYLLCTLSNENFNIIQENKEAIERASLEILDYIINSKSTDELAPIYFDSLAMACKYDKELESEVVQKLLPLPRATLADIHINSGEDLNRILELKKQENGLDIIIALNREYNISYFGRYSMKTLQYLYNNIGPCKKGNLVLWVVAKYDPVGSFYFDSNLLDQMIDLGFGIRVVEVGDESEFQNLIKKVVTTTGKKINVLVISGHGNPTSIQLGNKEDETAMLDITDEEQLNLLKSTVRRGGTIILNSCSTGNVEESKNIAKTISNYIKGDVFAPNEPSERIISILCEIDGDLIRVKDVEYSVPTTHYRHGRLKQ